MRGDVHKFKFCTFIQNLSGLIVRCFKIPHYAYSSRYSLLKKSTQKSWEKNLKTDTGLNQQGNQTGTTVGTACIT